MELSEKELIAMQEMMGFVRPSNNEEAMLQKSLYDKISAVVGTPESRKAEREKAERDAVLRKYKNSAVHLNKCLDSLEKYFEEKGISLESDSPVFLTDIKTGMSIQVA
jgi:hypothetical protein